MSKNLENLQAGHESGIRLVPGVKLKQGLSEFHVYLQVPQPQKLCFLLCEISGTLSLTLVLKEQLSLFLVIPKARCFLRRQSEEKRVEAWTFNVTLVRNFRSKMKQAKGSESLAHV